MLLGLVVELFVELGLSLVKGMGWGWAKYDDDDDDEHGTGTRHVVRSGIGAKVLH